MIEKQGSRAVQREGGGETESRKDEETERWIEKERRENCSVTWITERGGEESAAVMRWNMSNKVGEGESSVQLNQVFVEWERNDSVDEWLSWFRCYSSQKKSPSSSSSCSSFPSSLRPYYNSAAHWEHRLFLSSTHPSLASSCTRLFLSIIPAPLNSPLWILPHAIATRRPRGTQPMLRRRCLISREQPRRWRRRT